MKVGTSFKFNFGDLNDFYFDLLSQEDFDFRTKGIKLEVFNDENLEVRVSCSSILELKIATTALVKSLEVIEKTIDA